VLRYAKGKGGQVMKAIGDATSKHTWYLCTVYSMLRHYWNNVCQSGHSCVV